MLYQLICLRPQVTKVTNTTIAATTAIPVQLHNTIIEAAAAAAAATMIVYHYERGEVLNIPTNVKQLCMKCFLSINYSIHHYFCLVLFFNI